MIEYLQHVLALIAAVVMSACMISWFRKEGLFNDFEGVDIIMGLGLFAATLLLPYLIIGIAITLAILTATAKILELIMTKKRQ